MTLQEAQEAVDQWIRTYGVRYFSELTNMAVLTEEVGELARVMSRRYGDQSFKPGEPTDPADEMAWPTRRAPTSPRPSGATLTRKPGAMPRVISTTRN